MDAAASWPPFCLDHAHPIFLKQLRMEVEWMLVIAAIVASAFACATAVFLMIATTHPTPLRDHILLVLLAISGASACVVAPLEATAIERLKKHPSHALQPGARERDRLVRGWLVVGVGFGSAFLVPPALLVFGGMPWKLGLLGCGCVLLMGLLAQWAPANGYLDLLSCRLGRSPMSRRHRNILLLIGLGTTPLLPMMRVFAFDLALIYFALAWPFTIAAFVVAWRAARMWLRLRHLSRIAEHEQEICSQ